MARKKEPRIVAVKESPQYRGRLINIKRKGWPGYETWTWERVWGKPDKGRPLKYQPKRKRLPLIDLFDIYRLRRKK